MWKWNPDITELRNNLMVLNLLLFNNVFIPKVIGDICYALLLAISFIIIVTKPISFNNGYRMALILYCFSGIVSTIYSQYFSNATLLSVCQFVLWTLIVALMNKNEIRDILEKYLKILTAVICVAIIYSFLLKTFGKLSYVNNRWVNYFFNINIKQYAMGMVGDLGYAAFYENTNIFGFLILIVMTWNLCNQKIKLSLRSAVFVILMIEGLLLADSRAAFVCAFLNLCLLVFFNGGKNTKRLICMLIFLALAYDIYRGASLNVDVDLAGREIMWKTMWNVFKDNMLLGIGFANSTKYVLEDIGSHNSYLNILVENGLIGMGFFVFMVICVLNLIFKTQTNIRRSKLYFFATIVFIMFLPYAFIENALMIFETRHTLWILVGTFIVEEAKYIYDSHKEFVI